MPLGKRLKKLLRVLGPGFITGASGDDPTAIATYTQAGARFGYGLLWTAVFTLPFMIAIQAMCGKIGMVTGKGLAALIRRHYPRPLLYAILVFLCLANTINIGANLGAMAASAQLLWNLPFIWWLLILTFSILIIEVFVSYQFYARFLKFLTLILPVYIVAALLVEHDWLEVLKSSFIPHFSMEKKFWFMLTAILGSNISPYLFFWQANEEVEEAVAKKKILAMGRGTPKVTRRDVRRLRADTIIGMIFSNIIVFFIGLTAAATLGANGITNVTTPDQAANALRPLAGDAAFVLFALGVIGSGLLAVPILAGSASYALSEAFSWKEGLYRKFSQAHGFYGVMTAAIVLSLLVNFTPISPFNMLIYAAAFNAVLAPILILMALHIGNSKKIMGRFTVSLKTNIACGLIAALMASAAGIFFWTLF